MTKPTASMLRIGDEIELLGGRQTVHAIHPYGTGVLQVHFTSGLAAVMAILQPVDIIQHAPATDDDFKDL